jgi:hypothetical protein
VVGITPLIGVFADVATAVNDGSLATSCAKNRIFGTCNPVLLDEEILGVYRMGHMFPVVPEVGGLGSHIHQNHLEEQHRGGVCHSRRPPLLDPRQLSGFPD